MYFYVQLCSSDKCCSFLTTVSVCSQLIFTVLTVEKKERTSLLPQRSRTQHIVVSLCLPAFGFYRTVWSV